jgi:hypothetical protein
MRETATVMRAPRGLRWGCDLFQTKSGCWPDSSSGVARIATPLAFNRHAATMKLHACWITFLPSGFYRSSRSGAGDSQPWGEQEMGHGTRFPGANAKSWLSIMSPQFAATHKLSVATRRIARNSVTCAKTNHRQREELKQLLRNAQRRLRRGARASTRYQQRMPVSQAAATGCSSLFHREDYRVPPLVLYWDKLSLYNTALGLRRPLHRCESARFRTARATGTD